MPDWKSLADKARQEVRNAEQIHIAQAVARVEPSRCTGCLVCIPIGHCYALEMVEAKDGIKHKSNKSNQVALVNPYDCTGCHTCFDLCPTDCFVWENVPADRKHIPV